MGIGLSKNARLNQMSCSDNSFPFGVSCFTTNKPSIHHLRVRVLIREALVRWLDLLSPQSISKAVRSSRSSAFLNSYGIRLRLRFVWWRISCENIYIYIYILIYIYIHWQAIGRAFSTSRINHENFYCFVSDCCEIKSRTRERWWWVARGGNTRSRGSCLCPCRSLSSQSPPREKRYPASAVQGE